MNRSATVFLREEKRDKTVRITGLDKPQISSAIEEKWQRIINLIARILNVPSGLIMEITEDSMSVFLKSNNGQNPYKNGGCDNLGKGLYCETVIGANSEFLVENARPCSSWKGNPDVKLNMISYYGLPIRWPDGEFFGTICVLDDKRNSYDETFKELIIEFRSSIEKDLEIEIQAQGRGEQLLAINKSQEQLKMIGDNLPEGMVYRLIHGPDGTRRLSYASEGCSRLFQVKREDICQDANVLYNMIAPEFLAPLALAEKKSIENSETFEFEMPMTLPDGETRWIRWHSKASKEGDTFVWDGVCLDVTRRVMAEKSISKAREKLETQVHERTRDLYESNQSLKNEIQERKKIETNLAKSEGKYRGLIDNSLVGVLTTTSDGYMTFINDALAKIFDFETSQMILGQRFKRHWRYIKDRDRMLDTLRKNGSVINFEAEAVTHKGRHIQILFSAKSINNEILGMVMDITELKQAKIKLQSAYSEIK